MSRNFHALLAAMVLAGFAGCGCDTVPSPAGVKEYIVEIALETGQKIQEKARTLADALATLWRRHFPEIDNNVEVDARDPNRGRLKGVLVRKRTVIQEVDGERRVTVELDERIENPRMVRKDENSPWNPDPEECGPLLSENLESEG